MNMQALMVVMSTQRQRERYGSRDKPTLFAIVVSGAVVIKAANVKLTGSPLTTGEKSNEQ